MRISPFIYRTSVRNYKKKSTLKIYRKTENGWTVLEDVDRKAIPKPKIFNNNQTCTETNNAQNNDDTKSSIDANQKCRKNEMKIQMLPKSLYEQIFTNNQINHPPDEQTILK